MKPLLTHSNPTLMETMPSCCLGLSRVLTSAEQLSRHPAMMGGVLTDDMDPSEGGIVTSAPAGFSNSREDSFDFSRNNSVKFNELFSCLPIFQIYFNFTKKIKQPPQMFICVLLMKTKTAIQLCRKVIQILIPESFCAAG